MKKLIIAEKPSVGQTIAKVVGASERHDGYLESENYIVSWCVGHLCELAPPEAYDEKYGKWRMEDLPIMPERFELNVNESSKDVFDTLKTLIARSDVDGLICATDAGREGECIFRYVYSLIGKGKPFKRLWTSSLEDGAIRAGLADLRESEDFDSLYAAGFARAKADWLVGMNFTRLFSLCYNTPLNVGRVQTPTLAMIVDRDKKIETFQKEKFYVVTLSAPGYPSFAESERLGEQKAKELAKTVNGNEATVTELTTERKTENPPKLYDLTSLQRDANRLYGYSAAQTLEIAQKLYEAKILTYPRTDSRYITSDMRGYYLESLKNLLYEGEPNIDRVIDDSKVSDHTALLLTPHAAWANRDKSEVDICDLIARRMAVAVDKPYIYDKTAVKLERCGAGFTGNGRTNIDLGYKLKEIPDPEAKKGSVLPPLTNGECIPVTAAAVERTTSPPKRFTEDTLLSAMENAAKDRCDAEVERKGLGTPATRAGIIEGLIKRGYVERNKKQLVSTERGRALIDIVPPAVRSAELTAEWENKLLELERGERNDGKFIEDICEYVKQSCRAYGKAGASGVFSTVIGKCPICGASVIERKLSYSCENDDCLVIWKKTAGKEISKAHAKALLEKGRTEVIKGFKNKEGKTFDAMLKLDGKKTVFEFPSKKKNSFDVGALFKDSIR